MKMNLKAKILISIGTVLLISALFLAGFGRIPWFGRLPGDLYLEWHNIIFYLPVTTCVLISLIVTLMLRLIYKKNK